MRHRAPQQAEAILPDVRTLTEVMTEAHVPSLAVALVHLTGDMDLLRSLTRPVYKVGDATGGLPEDQIARIRRGVVAALQAPREGSNHLPPAALREMMNFIAGTDIPERYLPFLLEELAIDGENARGKVPEIAVADERKQGFRVLIIGGGMSGMLSAIQLEKAGIPYVIVEKNRQFGGTWYENAYPGCRVDSPNHLYGYSFEAADWPQFYSTRDVLFDYFRRCAEKYGLHRHARLGSTVEEAIYDERRCRWSVRIRDGEGRAEVLEANAIISAVGQLNQPRYPEIEGRESFAGPSFHSARWNQDCDLRGKRVAVIGSGASAFQFLPEIAPQTDRLFLFQRSAPWLAPAPDYHRDVPAGKQWLLRNLPYYKTWYRFWLFWMLTDGLYASVTRDPAWQGPPNAIGPLNDNLRLLLTQHISSQTGDDRELLRQVLPTYPPGGKRMLRDNGTWIATLKRPNVEIVSTPIRRITPHGLAMRDGREIPVDVVIYGTGFHASDFLSGIKVVGRGGVELHLRWDGTARAYLGMTIPGFPNLFCLYGPNTNIVVNGSIIFFSECSVRYILGCLKLLLERGRAALECREEVHDAYVARIDQANERMAWGAPQVSSWYKNKQGRVTQNWPFPLVDYWTATLAPDPADFIFTAG